MAAPPASAKPSIAINVNGHAALSGDPISATPRIELTITSTNTVNTVRLSLDTAGPTNLTISGASPTFYATYETTSALADGFHGFTVEAFDVAGSAATSEIFPLYVQTTAAVAAQGTPLSYPNPFSPGLQNVTFAYMLSKPANITLRIYDLAGDLITKRELASTDNGGRAGYNTFTWDGLADGSGYVGNGLYLYLLIAEGKVIQNGKGKVTVFR